MSALLAKHTAPPANGLNPLRHTVCAVLHTLTVGGAEVLAARLARRLNDRYRFVFACLDDEGLLGQELRRDGFEVHQLGRRPGIDLRCVRRLARFARQNKVDVLHSHQYTPFFYASLARGLSRIPIIFTEHGRHFPDFPRKARMFANRWLLRSRDRAIGVGGSVRDALVRNEGLRPDSVSVIYNGIDWQQYVADHERDRVRHELALRPDEIVIAHVARLDALKDHVTAIRAFRLIHDRLPHARLLVVGEGAERQAIELQIAQSNLQGSVVLAGLRRDVPRILSACDIVWLTSVSEGIPLTLIEGMAASLPVVATQVGGVAEVVEENVTGLLAPAGDAEAISKAALRLATDASLRHRFAAAGQRRARNLFSEERMVAAYADLYDELSHE